MIGWLYCVIIISGCLVTALRDVKVTVPRAARRGDSVVLHCHYDLQGDPLYSVKWYKGRAEFYRYSPSEQPPDKLFPIPSLRELTVDRTRSNQSQVLLLGVSPAMSGQFGCEVSADSPSFRTATVTANLEVVEVPLQPPSLTGVKSRYRVRDTLRANCTAAPSRPAVNLTWGINGENVDPRLVKQYRLVPGQYPDLTQSSSVLEVTLRSEHFGRTGGLKVRCTASLYDLYWQTTERGAVGEGLRDNRVWASDRPAWDDYGDYSGDSALLGAFPSESSSESRSSTSLTTLTTHPYWPTVAIFLLLHIPSLL